MMLVKRSLEIMSIIGTAVTAEVNPSLNTGG